MDPAGLPSGGNFKTLLDGYGLGRFKKYATCNSFDLLIHFLENPDLEKWQRFMLINAVMHTDPKRYIDADSVKEWMHGIETLLPGDLADTVTEADCPGCAESCLYGNYYNGEQNTDTFLKQYVVAEKKALAPPGNPLGVRVGCCLNDGEEKKEEPGFQSSWNGFLRLYNYYQFLPYAYFVTSEGNNAKAYDSLKLYEESIAETPTAQQESAEHGWDTVKEMTDDQFHQLLDLLKEHEWPVPEAGYELEGENGEITACAELAWETIKIAFLTDDESKYQGTFMADGWKTVSISEVLNDPEKYLSMKNTSGE